MRDKVRGSGCGKNLAWCSAVSFLSMTVSSNSFINETTSPFYIAMTPPGLFELLTTSDNDRWTTGAGLRHHAGTPLAGRTFRLGENVC